MIDEIKSIVNSHDIVVFSSPTCPYCSSAIQAIEAAGHKPHVVNCSWDIREGLLDLTHSKSVPNIWLKGKYVGGCNDGPEPWMGIKKIINNGKLGEFLQ